MLGRAGFGNGDDIAATDDPSQCNRRCRALMCGTDLAQCPVPYYEIMIAAERRIRHHRHIVLRAPGQNVTLNATVVETIGDLVGRAAMTVWNLEQIFHLLRVEVGYTPGANFSCRAQLFESRYDTGKLPARDRRMQQIQIEMVGTETSETCRARPGDPISGYFMGFHFGDHE